MRNGNELAVSPKLSIFQRHQRQQADQSRRNFDREQMAAMQQQAAAEQQHREMLRSVWHC